MWKQSVLYHLSCVPENYIYWPLDHILYTRRHDESETKAKRKFNIRSVRKVYKNYEQYFYTHIHPVTIILFSYYFLTDEWARLHAIFIGSTGSDFDNVCLLIDGDDVLLSAMLFVICYMLALIIEKSVTSLKFVMDARRILQMVQNRAQEPLMWHQQKYLLYPFG